MTFNNTECNNIVIPAKNPTLKLVGTDGNAFALMGRAREHARRHKLYNSQDLRTIMDECMSGNYDHLLATLMYFFNVK